MKIKKHILKSSLISLLVLVSTTNIFAENHSNEPSEIDEYDPVPDIMHHIQDAHEWHFWGNVSIPLPIILYREGKIDIFMSSKFHHNEDEIPKFPNH